MTKAEWWRMMDDFEGKVWFKNLVNIIFWFSIFAAGFFIPFDYKITLYILGIWLLLIVCVYWPLFLKKSLLNAFTDFGNIIDDPIDDLKHKIHGMKIFGHTIHLPDWLMRNKEEENQ